MGLKICPRNRLGIPQEKIAARLRVLQRTVSNHLPKMPKLAKWVNTALRRKFTVLPARAHPPRCTWQAGLRQSYNL